jgi:ribosome-associated protein
LAKKKREIPEKIKKIVTAADGKKAQNIVVLDVNRISSIASYFVLCTGDNPRQNQAIAEDIREKLSGIDIKPLHSEGTGGSGWVLMDYDDIIIHIFLPEVREFYDLEGLWGDAPTLPISDLISGH